MQPHATTSRRSVLAAAGGAALGSMLGLVGLAGAAEKPVTVNMVAKKFVFLPATLRVKVGQPVTLQLTAPEVAMGFSLPDFNVRADIVPGQTATVRFTPDKAGTFTFLCDLFCGSGHEDMSGTLTVV